MEQLIPGLGQIGKLISDTTASVNATAGTKLQPEVIVEKAAGMAVGVVLNLVFASLILVGGWLLATWFSGVIYRGFKRTKMEETYANFLGSIAKYCVIFIAVLWALTFFGLTSTSLVAVLGAAGLAIGLSLKDFLTHIAAGVMLMMTRPFKVGDYIECDGLAGTVRRITLFNTEINTLYNQRIFMPNGTVWSNPILNHSYNNTRQAEVRVMVSFEAEPEVVAKTITAALAANNLILQQPLPFVGIDTFGDRGVVYLVRCWCRRDNYMAVRYGILRDIRKALETADLVITHLGGADFPRHPKEDVEVKKVAVKKKPAPKHGKRK